MKVVLTVLFVLAFSFCVFAQLSEEERSWNHPVEPFRIAGNIYYVGASDITSYLIVTPKGHVLLDSGFRETVPQIVSNIAKLGFKLEDVKFIINSHAHYDHVGGLAELKRLAKAKLYVSEEDAKLLARGGKADPNFGDRFLFEPVTADKTFNDGWQLKLGDTELQANITPGHTKGCTTWTTTVIEGGRDLNVIFVCSTTTPGYKLVGNPDYPEIVSDYESTFKRMKAFKVDVFLSSHASAFGMIEKLQIRKNGTKTNPFIDPAGYLEYLDATEKGFRKLLTEPSRGK